MTTAAPDLLRLAIRLRHHSSCTAPQTDQIQGNRGDHGLRCRTCHSSWFPPAHLIETLPTERQDPDPEPEPEPEPLAPRRSLDNIPAPPPSTTHRGWPTHKARARRRSR